jgi:dipeptidyl aminopeptidase/acylaminoacyl peptidase
MAVRSDDRRGCGEPALCWSATTGRLYFEVAEGGRGPLGWVTPGGASGRLFDGERVCLGPSVAARVARLAVVVTDSGNPGDVHVCDELDPRLEALAPANPWLDAGMVGPTELVRAVADDGVPIEAWLTMPPPAAAAAAATLAGAGATPAGAGATLAGAGATPGASGHPAPPAMPAPPMLVSVHGGPHHAVGWRFCFEAQRLAGRGIAVLSPNPRGSLGYGGAFAAGNAGDWGGRDWRDVEALVDAALALGTVDPDRIAIGGTSYGGYLAQWAVTQTDRFRAAISENGICNLFGQWGSGTDHGDELTAELGATPWGDARTLVDRSPLRHADRVRTPLLLLHAELDASCPVEQSMQMHTALRYLGRRCELVVLEGEGHLVNLLGRPSRRVVRAAAVDEHLDRCLGGSPEHPALQART